MHILGQELRHGDGPSHAWLILQGSFKTCVWSSKALTTPVFTPLKHGGLMELTVRFQTANGDGSTQVSLALILSLSSLHTPPAKATPHTQKTAIPSLLPAVPAEMDGKAQISSVKVLVLSWSQLKLCAATWQHYSRPALA